MVEQKAPDFGFDTVNIDIIPPQTTPIQKIAQLATANAEGNVAVCIQ
jgi:hypothetical protein